MEVFYHKGFSHNLGRDMEYKRYGHGGRPVVMFPTSRGRFFQYEDTGTIAALGEFIDSGRIQVWTLDGIDGETFFSDDPDLSNRIARHEAYFRYVREEALADIVGVTRATNSGLTPKPIFSGCSMGAYHAANFVFRFPELVSGVIALSGVYSTRDFMGGELGGAIYFNSPIDYLAGLGDPEVLDRLRVLRLIFCCGQGAWEERMIRETHQLEDVLKAKGIPAWIDFWGNDVSHDWVWWHRQIVYFMDHWLADDLNRRVA
jgi:esterase/lipase superfamily enzyme